MDCRETAERLALYVYGDLDADEARAVAEHLGQCASCAAEHERIEHARQGLDTFSPIEAPADVAAIANWAHSVDHVRRGDSARRGVWIGIAAGVVAFIVLSLPGARFERSAQGWSLSIGAGSRAPVAPLDRASLDEEVKRGVALALDRIEELQRAWFVAQDERFADVLATLRIESEHQRFVDSLHTQELVDGLVQAVAIPSPRPYRP